MLLPLKKDKWHYLDTKRRMDWISAPPFVIKKMAKLVHRPRSVTRYEIHKTGPHIAVRYWCGGGGFKSGEFADTLNDDAIMCAKCEAIATLNGLPSSFSITGKHVHVGGCKAVKYCCQSISDE